MELDNFKHNLPKLKKCDQYWDEMNPVLGGKLCSKCDKKIVDFSSMTFSDIAIYMSESKEPVCGFYLPEQLIETKISNIRLPLAIGLTTLLTTSNVSTAQKLQLSIEQISIADKSLQDKRGHSLIKNEKNIDSVFLIGKVQSIDTLKQESIPISYAAVVIKGTKSGVATMEDGQFKLPYLPCDGNDNLFLVVSSIGFTSTEIEVKLNGQTQIDLGNINLEPAQMIEFYVTVKKRSKLNKFWRKITKPFRR